MKRFLYFLEGFAGVRDCSALKNAGLGYVAGPGEELSSVTLQLGPGGGSGVLFGRGDGVGFGYDAETQEWVERCGTGGLPTSAALLDKLAVAHGIWIGCVKNARPGPDDLAKAKTCDGHAVTLGDGNAWTIPLVRLAEAIDGDGGLLCGTKLPCVLLSTSTGGTKMKVRRDLLPLFDAVWETHAAVTGRAAKKLTYADVRSLCVKLLAVNYRVRDAELDLLEALGTDNWEALVNAALDLEKEIELRREWLAKKNGAGGSGPSSNAGAGA